MREVSASLCRCLGSSRGPAEWEEGRSRRKDRAGGAKGGVKDRRGHVWKGGKKERGARGRNSPHEAVGKQGRKGRERGGLPHPGATSALGVEEKLWESKQRWGEFLSAFKHSQPSQGTIKMGAVAKRECAGASWD